MLVHPDGTFITARRYPELLQLQPSFREGDLVVTHRHSDVVPLTIPREPETEETLMVEVWGDRVLGQLVSPLADAWFSEQLGSACRLVYMPEQAQRLVDPRYAQAGEVVSFADGYPYLLIGEASLVDLNRRLSEAVSMRRFRPNLVVAGTVAYAEDGWRDFRVGAVDFSAVKPCARCVLVTIDPDSGQSSKEPLATLAGYRQQQGKVLFGMNLLARTQGTLHVGDPLTLTPDGNEPASLA
jgi:hypothetical protein